MSSDSEQRIPLGFGDLYGSPGDHIGHFYESRDEWKTLASGFLRTGLAAGNRCVYIVNRDFQPELLELLEKDGVDVNGALESGSLTFDEGRSTPEEMQEFLRAALAEIPDKYPFLRWGGHMSWSVDKMATTELLMEWESACNVVHDAPAVFLCHYDLSTFLGSVVMDALRTHPVCVVGSTIHQNPFYEDPELFLVGLRSRSGAPDAA